MKQKWCELLPYRYKDPLPVYLFWKHLCSNLAFQSIGIRWPVAISTRRKPTHLTRGSPDTISELSKELLLHLILLLAVCFVGKSLQLINLESPCGQLHCLHYEKYTEISTADNLQINTEVGRETSNFNLFVSTGKYYQNTFFETIKMGLVSLPACLFPASAFLPLH